MSVPPYNLSSMMCFICFMLLIETSFLQTFRDKPTFVLIFLPILIILINQLKVSSMLHMNPCNHTFILMFWLQCLRFVPQFFLFVFSIFIKKKGSMQKIEALQYLNIYIFIFIIFRGYYNLQPIFYLRDNLRSIYLLILKKKKKQLFTIN